jgi:hypothetical protein
VRGGIAGIKTDLAIAGIKTVEVAARPLAIGESVLQTSPRRR